MRRILLVFVAAALSLSFRGTAADDCGLGALAGDLHPELWKRELRQLSFSLRLPDPALYVTPEGKIQIYGTGFSYLQYRNWDEFLTGVPGEEIKIRLFDGFGRRRVPIRNEPWDLLIQRWPHDDPKGVEVLYLAHSVTGMPQDQRIYAARRASAVDSNTWVLDPKPLFGLENAGSGSWVGHAYGHRFVTDAKGDTWLFYEKVTQEHPTPRPLRGKPGIPQTLPSKTIIFVRKMIPDGEGKAYRPEDDEHPVSWENHPFRFPLSRRSIGDRIVEGPSPYPPVSRTPGAPPVYGFTFSAGAWWDKDHYGIQHAHTGSGDVTGPYSVDVKERGKRFDLKDLGAKFRPGGLADKKLVQGPARAFFFQDPKGDWWVLFHATPAGLYDIKKDNRRPYLAPAQLLWRADGSPKFRILASDP